MPASQASPSSVVALVRHAQTGTTGKVLPGRAPGLHLAEAGRAQADLAAQRIAELGRVAGVHTSPLERARETASPIAERLGVPVEVEAGLLECDFGAWTGASLDKLSALPEWRAVQTWPSGFRFPDGESFREMQTRMVDTVERLRDRHAGAIVVAVSHADCIKAYLAHVLGVHLDLFQRIVISPASVSLVAYDGHGTTVLAVNSTGDLTPFRSADPAKGADHAGAH